MSHRKSAPKAHLHTTIKPEILEILASSAPKRGWGKWLEDAILTHAAQHGDLRALTMQESALMARKNAIKEQIKALTMELGNIEGELAEIRAMRERFQAVSPEMFLNAAIELINREDIKEWLGELNSPVILIRHTIIENVGGLELTETYREYKATEDTIDAYMDRFLNRTRHKLERIREQAKRSLVPLSEQDLIQHIRPVIAQYIQAETKAMSERSLKAARENIKRKLERISQAVAP